jgi:hypothetical protein
MARFYGTVKGGRGEASRLGHPSSGLRVAAQSHSGDIVVDLHDQDGEDYVHIFVREHVTRAKKSIYSGPIATLLSNSARATMLRALAPKKSSRNHQGM